MKPENNPTDNIANTPTKGQLASDRFDYLTARRSLKAALAQGGLVRAETKAIPNALDRLIRSFERSVVEPLLEEATVAANPVTGALLMAAADVIERLHDSSPLVLVSRGQGLGRRDVREQPISAKELETRMKLVDQLIAIRRELTRKR